MLASWIGGLLLMTAPLHPAVAQPATAEQRWAQGMTNLNFIVGPWLAEAERVTKTGEWEKQDRGPLRFAPILNGRYIECEGKFLGQDFRATLSFDRHDGRYRLALLDDQSGVMDIYTGDIDASGELVLISRQFFRVRLERLAGGGFRWHYAGSRDEGRSYTEFSRTTFKRP